MIVQNTVVVASCRKLSLVRVRAGARPVPMRTRTGTQNFAKNRMLSPPIAVKRRPCRLCRAGAASRAGSGTRTSVRRTRTSRIFPFLVPLVPLLNEKRLATGMVCACAPPKRHKRNGRASAWRTCASPVPHAGREVALKTARPQHRPWSSARHRPSPRPAIL
jgi:hypothetical protein